jgi:hypothetical protein
MKSNEITQAVRATLNIRTWNSQEAKRDGLTALILLRDVYHTYLTPEVRNAVYGIFYTTQTARCSAAISLTLRDMNAFQVTKLVGMVAAECHLTTEVVRWLNAHEAEVLALLPNNKWV